MGERASTKGLTKSEQRWQWLAGRIWHGTFSGWAQLSDRVTKADREIIARKVKLGHVERDDYGLYRLTDEGLTNLADAHKNPLPGEIAP